jgi:hypothetical protein
MGLDTSADSWWEFIAAIEYQGAASPFNNRLPFFFLSPAFAPREASKDLIVILLSVVVFSEVRDFFSIIFFRGSV